MPTMSNSDQLPLAADHVEFELSPEQVEVLSPLLVLQRCRDKSVIFTVAAQSYDAEKRKAWLRLQFKVCERRAAMRAIAIIRKSELK
jgi:hypothetical protein